MVFKDGAIDKIPNHLTIDNGNHYDRKSTLILCKFYCMWIEDLVILLNLTNMCDLGT